MTQFLSLGVMGGKQRCHRTNNYISGQSGDYYYQCGVRYCETYLIHCYTVISVYFSITGDRKECSDMWYTVPSGKAVNPIPPCSHPSLNRICTAEVHCFPTWNRIPRTTTFLLITRRRKIHCKNSVIV